MWKQARQDALINLSKSSLQKKFQNLERKKSNSKLRSWRNLMRMLIILGLKKLMPSYSSIRLETLIQEMSSQRQSHLILCLTRKLVQLAKWKDISDQRLHKVSLSISRDWSNSIMEGCLLQLPKLVLVSEMRSPQDRVYLEFESLPWLRLSTSVIHKTRIIQNLKQSLIMFWTCTVLLIKRMLLLKGQRKSQLEKLSKQVWCVTRQLPTFWSELTCS